QTHYSLRLRPAGSRFAPSPRGEGDFLSIFLLRFTNPVDDRADSYHERTRAEEFHDGEELVGFFGRRDAGKDTGGNRGEQSENGKENRDGPSSRNAHHVWTGRFPLQPDHGSEHIKKRQKV